MKVNGDRLPERERLPWDLATILINILNEWPIAEGDRQNKKSIIAIIIAEVGLSQRQASCGRSSRRKAATEEGAGTIRATRVPGTSATHHNLCNRPNCTRVFPVDTMSLIVLFSASFAFFNLYKMLNDVHFLDHRRRRPLTPFPVPPPLANRLCAEIRMESSRDPPEEASQATSP